MIKVYIEKFENFIFKFYSGFLFTILGITIVLFLLTILSSYFDGYIINDKTLKSLHDYNTQIVKLRNLENKLYSNEDELIFEINNLIDPQYYSDNRLEYILINSYQDTSNSFKRFYFIKPIDSLLISDKNIISKIKVLENQFFKTLPEIEQQLKSKIGFNEFGKVSTILSENYGHNPLWINKLLFFLKILVVIAFTLLPLAISVKIKKDNRNLELRTDTQITKAKIELENNPEKIRPAWEYANLTLQKYYDRNLKQVNSIYNLSIVVMVSGFILIITTLILNVFYDIDSNLNQLGIISGVITEFIGGTFLFVYKSTMSQALHYSNSLEKMNNVGMSISIIDSVEKKSANNEEINQAKIQLVHEIIKSK